jgi:hypothetical protein
MTADAGAHRGSRLREWLLQGLTDMGGQPVGPPPAKAEVAAHEGQAWYRVMCLTGVDYFSTLGYQPGIAALAAGLLSPVATLVLVVVTLAGALPVYRRVAVESPHGEGSIAMLERLLSFWKGKLFVLVLLGFAATDFLITMTLSAADAATHLVQNPHFSSALAGKQMLITLLLLALLGAVFLKGFLEAIGVAVVLVGLYLGLNVIVIADALYHVLSAPQLITDWRHGLIAERGSVPAVIGVSLLVFPKLALGMSGFETGVAVMPYVKGDLGDTEAHPKGRIRDTRKLLTAAAITMSCFLITSSFVTTVLIPKDTFQPGGQANGRALAFLAHRYLGSGFATLYDFSTIAILWFAGASAMAGLLSLMPRYLPRYGMAPHWARAVRPMVLVFIVVAFVVTWAFDASVDKQGGAYATGVLVLMSSAAAAVTISSWRRRQRKRAVGYGVIAVVFFYTTADNVVERPDGVRIGACFIAGIVVVSLLSRVARSFELRVTSVELDPMAQRFVRDAANRRIRLVANQPHERDEAEYRDKARRTRADNDIPAEDDLIFVEVTVRDPSEFESALSVYGKVVHGKYRVLLLDSAAVPNALAALLLNIRDATGRIPHIYFEWTEGNPLSNLTRFFLVGQGEVAPVTREVLREAEPDRNRRPHVHAG